MTDTMSLERQAVHVEGRFSELFPNTEPRAVWDDETIVVYPNGLPNETPFFWLMEIGSDDDRYRFELWHDGRDTGIYVEFAFEGESL